MYYDQRYMSDGFILNPSDLSHQYFLLAILHAFYYYQEFTL